MKSNFKDALQLFLKFSFSLARGVHFKARSQLMGHAKE